MKQELEYNFDPFWGKTAGSLMVQSHRSSPPRSLYEVCLLWSTFISIDLNSKDEFSNPQRQWISK